MISISCGVQIYGGASSRRLRRTGADETALLFVMARPLCAAYAAFEPEQMHAHLNNATIGLAALYTGTGHVHSHHHASATAATAHAPVMVRSALSRIGVADCRGRLGRDRKSV